MTLREAIDSLAEIALATAALYVFSYIVRGWLREQHARTADTQTDRDVAETDARTFYVLAGLQRPWVWCLIFLGSAVKLVIGVHDLLSAIFGQPVGV